LRIKIHQEYFHTILFRDLVERYDISHPKAVTDLAHRLIDKTPFCKLQEFFSIFEGILMWISEETASNLHTSAFSISLRPVHGPL
jgi:hypothetical protein